MENLNIREADARDLDLLQELYGQLDSYHAEILPENFQTFEGPRRPKEILKEKINNLDKVILIAFNENRAVGYADAQVCSNPPYPMFRKKSFVLVDNVFVIPSERRLGIGKKLFNAVEDWSMKKGHLLLRLKVYASNKVATAFYNSLGFYGFSQEFEKKIVC